MAQSKIFAVVVLFAINQVCAKRCYECLSQTSEECKTNPRQKQFEISCQEFDSDGILFSNQWLERLAVYRDSEASGTNSGMFTYHCATATYTNITNGQSALARGCVAKHLNDESLKILTLTTAALQVDKIHRCHSDLCNSN